MCAWQGTGCSRERGMSPDIQVAVVGVCGTALTAAATVVVAVIQTRAKQREQNEAREERGSAEVSAREPRAALRDSEPLVAVPRLRSAACEGAKAATGTGWRGRGGAPHGSATPTGRANDDGAPGASVGAWSRGKHDDPETRHQSRQS